MDYKFLFIVTSAIIPFKVGSANNQQERYEQTIKTISSNASIIPLVSSSDFPKLNASGFLSKLE